MTPDGLLRIGGFGLAAALLFGGCRSGTTRRDAAPDAPVVMASPASAPASRPSERVTRVLRGNAIRYGDRWHGKRTASGEPFDRDALTAAHRTLPLGTRVRVTNLLNGRQVIVRINDRGPFGADRARIIDLSHAAARQLDFGDRGSIRAKLEVLAD